MPFHLVDAHLTPAQSMPLDILVADDDPASCRFLCDGLRSLGANPIACSDGPSTLTLARHQSFDLLLLDCRMPGGGARQILTDLRQDPQAESSGSEAIASTADLTREEKDRLLQAGFSDILLKPCTIANLRTLLENIGAPVDTLLDDSVALNSSGDRHTMRALRILLHQELQQLSNDLDSLSSTPVTLSERLHRLRSSCGFCGASALAGQAASLQQQLCHSSSTTESTTESTSASLLRFHRILKATLRALEN